MSKLKSVSSSPTLIDFAQGAAQQAIQPVADFIAPGVDVPTSTGRFKIYTEKNRFRIPDTLRGLGGRATELRFEASDGVFDCQPHALDYPIDNLEKLETRQLEDSMKEGAVAVAEVAGLAHEKKVIDTALDAAGSGTGVSFGENDDPVSIIDQRIRAVILAARYGSLMGVGVLFGAAAWTKFKNHAKVRSSFIVGNPKAGNTATPTLDAVSPLLLANPEVRATFMVYDDAPEGKKASMKFILDDVILVFARKATPSRRDPSFMKTFRLMGQWMVPGSYERDDGRVEVAKFDWSEDARVSNVDAVARMNVN